MIMTEIMLKRALKELHSMKSIFNLSDAKVEAAEKFLNDNIEDYVHMRTSDLVDHVLNLV